RSRYRRRFGPRERVRRNRTENGRRARRTRPYRGTETGDGGESMSADRPRVLFIDNFDSFTYNLVEYVSAHADCEVVRNTVSLADVRAADPDGIVMGPGPGHPENDRDVGVTLDALQEVSPDTPTLGV